MEYLFEEVEPVLPQRLLVNVLSIQPFLFDYFADRKCSILKHHHKHFPLNYLVAVYLMHCRNLLHKYKLMLFFSPRNSPSFFSQPPSLLLGGVLGPVYVVILTIATPNIGIAMTMIGILAGQIFKSLIIDHYGLFGTTERKIDVKRIIALAFIIISLVFMAQG
ncbi:DMT family transporter [Pseudoalteromonas sp. S3260]|uniref:DMT family transporter n=1 Tax=Pseudoalteromonas sp. S3260 TaxID=579534 RepID=UPI00201E10CF|nr:DMT family transporter [Pseudoalteromonas sp. S3260]